MNADQLKDLLDHVRDGSLEVEQAVEQLRNLPFEDIGFAHVDHHRHLRRGFPEVIYCPGKTPEQVAGIFSALAAKGHNVLATRAGVEAYQAVAAGNRFGSALRYEKQARAIILEQEKIQRVKSVLPVITAGTADMPVAAEAVVTAELMGQPTELICDVGVAGLHRLLGHMPKIRDASIVIVVAGMEGALASVVGGMVACPVIAVPTSVGFGTSFGGVSALLTMLNSCCAGIVTVNIDNGFSAAVTASMINRKIENI